MSKNIDRFEPYCLNERCGDPVPMHNGEVVYSRRKLVHTGRTWLGEEIYTCPVCNRKRYFRLGLWSNDIVEI